LPLIMLAAITACDRREPAPLEPKDESQAQQSMLAARNSAGGIRLEPPRGVAPSYVVRTVGSAPLATFSTFNSRAAFLASGTVAFNTDFEGYTTSFHFPGTPWTVGGITYTTNSNLIVGTASGYNPPSAVFCNNLWSPMQGSVQAGYDMLGFDIGMLGNTTPVNATITTNQNTYYFPNLAIAHWTAGGSFVGFITSNSGEYFTGFHFASQQGTGSAPCVDNATLGNALIQVSVDIKPGSSPNSINPGSNGNVPVAILTTGSFDAASVDVSQVTLGDDVGSETPVAKRNNGTWMADLADADGDGDLDLVLHFRTQALVQNGDLTAGSTSLVLNGRTTGGQRIQGSDSVRIVP